MHKWYHRWSKENMTWWHCWSCRIVDWSTYSWSRRPIISILNREILQSIDLPTNCTIFAVSSAGNIAPSIRSTKEDKSHRLWVTKVTHSREGQECRSRLWGCRSVGRLCRDRRVGSRTDRPLRAAKPALLQPEWRSKIISSFLIIILNPAFLFVLFSQ